MDSGVDSEWILQRILGRILGRFLYVFSIPRPGSAPSVFRFTFALRPRWPYPPGVHSGLFLPLEEGLALPVIGNKLP